MANKNYIKGRNFEYRIMRVLRKIGYYCIRVYGSKGLFDIIAIPPYKQVTGDVPLLIQAKYNGYVPPKEMTKLKENDKWWGCPLIAFSKKGELRFRELNGTECGVDDL